MEHGESSSQNDRHSVSDTEILKKPDGGVSHGGILEEQRGKVAGSGGGGGEMEAESVEEGEDEEDDGKKVVEWTADDQKNLMDVGFSELERNKRLESLIAKRRARKLFRMAIEKSLKDSNNPHHSQIAPILIVKSNLHGVVTTTGPDTDDVLQMPGSAPCVLLPGHNPFDLPYDPLEEKPNLMADSFHQEFMAATQKDLFLCRHESFCRGPVFALETTQDIPHNLQFGPYPSTEKRPIEAATVSRFQRLSGSKSDLVDKLDDSNQNEAINSSEISHEESRESANDYRIGIEEVKMEKPHGIEPGLISRAESIRNNDSCCSSSSSSSSSTSSDELPPAKSPGQILNDHVRNNNLSIPPRAKTMNRLPYDSSPSPSDRRRVDLLLFNYPYRRHGHTPTCSIASDLQVEVSEIGSPPTTDGTVSPVADGDSVTYDGDIDRDVNSDNDELWGGSFNLSRNETKQRELLHGTTEEDSVDVELPGLKSKPEETVPETLSSENPGETMHSMEKTMDHSPYESCVEKPEQLIEPQNKLTEDLNIDSNMKPITHGDANASDSKSSQNIEDMNSDSIEHMHGNSETSNESKSTMESEKKMEESQPLKSIEKDTQNLADHNNTSKTPIVVQSRNELESVPDDVDGQDVIDDDNLSGVKQRIGDSIAMALNRRLMLEHLTISSCSSPRSVLPQNNLADQTPVSNVEQRIQTDAPRSNSDDIGGDNDSADEQLQENLTVNIEGSSEMTEKNTNSNTLDDMNELVLEDKHQKEDYSLKSNEGNAASIVHLEGGSDKPIEHDFGIDLSKTEEENVNSDVPETMKETHSPSNVIEKSNNAENIDNSEANEKEKGNKMTSTNEGEFQPEEATRGLEKSNDQLVDMNKTEATKRDNTSIPETAIQEEKSSIKVNSSVDVVNDALVDNKTEKEILNHVLDSEHEAVIEPSRTTGETSAVSVENTEHESRRSTDIDGQFASEGSESNSLDNIHNGEDIKISTSQEGVIEAPKPEEDTTRGISVDHEFAMEASKPTETEVKPVAGPEENDSNLVAN
ncbi:hypothetical protein CCACVL1_10918 [Corchorus capsularis]|uniref:Uncharacterized protein n=1 Tax=Corchorus capsularis TaxID=210143 RepID=A0A1R3INY6_COCAP|nr:hypothetical protein CCACVL1_10918 [Corchorus capsularis]